MLRGRNVLLVVMLGAWLSCTGAPGGDAGGDARPADADVDSGHQDVGWDARTDDDGGDDVGLADVDLRDTRWDAGSPDWVSIADGLPGFCRLFRADRPEALVELRIHLSPCPGRANCEVSDTIALSDGVRVEWRASDGHYALGFARSHLGDNWWFVSPLDGGPTIAAYRGGTGADDPLCALDLGALAADRLALGLAYYADGGRTAGSAIYVADIADAASIAAPLVDDRATFGVLFPQGLWLGSTAVVAWTSAGGLFDVSEGALYLMRDRSDPHSFGTQPSVFGSHVMWADYGTSHHVSLGQAGVDGGVTYYQPAAGNEVEVVESDGVDVAWTEGVVGATDPILELWTAPFVVDPAALAPRRVRTVTLWAHPRVADGMWADTRGTGPGPYSLELYDLADGRVRIWDETGLVDIGILFLSSTGVIYTNPQLDGEHLVRFDPTLLAYEP